MYRLGYEIEETNKRLIPLALVMLLAIIITEIFFHVENHALELSIKIADGMVIAVFVIDLIFLAIHSRNARFFFRNYWLDIVAVFPFAIIFNVVEEIYRSISAVERIVVGQAIFHEGLEAEKLAKEGRFLKMLRTIPRGLRLITKSHFFEKFRRKRQKARHKKKV